MRLVAISGNEFKSTKLALLIVIHPISRAECIFVFCPKFESMEQPPFLSKEKITAFVVLGVYLVLAFTWAINSEYAWDDDAPTRIYNCVDALNNPVHFVSLWSRPLFVLIFALPSMISIHAVHWIMPLISASAAYGLFLGMKKLNYQGALLCLPFLLFQPYHFILSYQAYTEPLAVALICWMIYAFADKRLVLLAVLGGLLPLARLELTPLLIFPALFLVKEKQWKAIIFLAVPTIFWHIAGAIILDDPLFLLNQTLLKDTESNRYGHNEWYVYLHRYLYVIGPVLFIPFLSGLFIALTKKKHFLLGIIFLFGFFIYTLFSWKLNLGNAAGFLRNITTLSPLAAIFGSIGVMAIWGFMNGQKRIPLPVFINKSKLGKNDEDQGGSKTKTWHGVFAILFALIGAMLACTHFAHEISNHHTIEDEKDYSIAFFGCAALFVFLGVAFVLKKRKNYLPYTYLITFSALSLAFITNTEPPNTSYSAEREKMAEVASFYDHHLRQENMTYANHVWFFWSQDYNKHDSTLFKTITQQNLKNADLGSTIVWDNHYSSRLAGDVDAGFFNRESKDFLELYRAYSKDRELLAIIYNKLPLDQQKTKMQAFYQEHADEASVMFAYAKFLAEKEGNAEESIIIGKEVIKKDTTIVDALGTVGMSYFNLRQWDSSLVYLQALEKRVKDNDQLFYNIGSAYFNKKDYPRAISYMNKAVAKNKAFPNARYVKAAALVNQNDFEGGLIELNKEVQVNPSNQAAWLLAGKVLFNKNDKANACKSWKKAADLGNQEALSLLANYCQ